MDNKLLKSLTEMKLSANAIKNLALAIKLLVVAIATFTVASLINTGIAEKREQQYLAEMRVFKEQAEVATRHADSLKKEVEIHDNAARIAKAKADKAARDAQASKNRTSELLGSLDSLKETITDSTEMARIIIPKQDSIIDQQSITIGKQDIQITFLNTALSSKDTALTLANQRGDSLQRVVNNIPTPPKPPLFPRISRKTVYVLGIATGIVLKVFVLK